MHKITHSFFSKKVGVEDVGCMYVQSVDDFVSQYVDFATAVSLYELLANLTLVRIYMYEFVDFWSFRAQSK